MRGEVAILIEQKVSRAVGDLGMVKRAYKESSPLGVISRNRGRADVVGLDGGKSVERCG